MASAAGLILSAVGTGLSLISLLTSNLNSNGHSDTTVKVTVACATVSDSANDADSVSGSVDIRLFTPYADEAGPPSVDHYINNGNTAYTIDYGLSDEHHGNQTPYLKVTGNNDAICIAWLTMTWPDGSDWAWSGQTGNDCGKLPYHYSASLFGTQKNDDGTNGDPFRPRCSWIDGDGSVGGDTTAFSVYMPYSTTENTDTFPNSQSRSRICGGSSLVTYQNDDGGSISYYTPPPDVNNENVYKRDVSSLEILNPANISINNVPSKRLYTPEHRNTHLIQSPHKEHSAVELCAADMSWGPSFISTYENKFCDMSTKTVYDLCTRDSLLSEACFDMEVFALKGFRAALSYNWKKFEQWGEETDIIKHVQL